jgi:hypothetical protein
MKPGKITAFKTEMEMGGYIKMTLMKEAVRKREMGGLGI